MSSDLDVTPPGAQVRLRYTSFINFALNITSAVFSVFFLVIVTRRLSIEDYATWVMIWRYVGYFLIPTVIFGIWATRDISRGKNSSLTCATTSIIFGIASIPFYLLVMIFLSGSLQQPLVPLLLSSLALLLDYLGNGLSSVSVGHSPQIVGYANFTFKAGSLAFGLIFMASFAFGLVEAVVVSLLGRVLMDAVYVYMNRSMLRRSSFQFSQIIIWMKSSWVPLFGSLAALLVTFDVLVVRLVYDSQIPVAYYGVCVSIASFAVFASVVSNSLYPKILVNRNLDDLKEAIWLTSLLSLPIIFLMMIYAEPLCAILNINYILAAFPLRIMLLGIYLSLMSGIASTVYYGLDPFDEKILESKALMKSSIFKGYRLSFILGGVYLALLFVLSLLSIDFIPFVSIWVFMLSSLYASSLIAFTLLIRRHFGMAFPFRSILKDVLVFAVPSLPAVVPSLVMPVSVNESFYLTLYSLVPTALVSLAIYFGILFIIEKRFRATFKDVMKNVFSLFRRG